MKARGIITGFCALAAVALSPEEPRSQWKISGHLEEACSCAAACPCWFNSKPTQSTCRGAEVLFITKGNFGKVKLDGLALANYTRSAENRTMGESFGQWQFSTDYIDEKATPAKRDALLALAGILLPSKNASPLFQTKFVSIVLQRNGPAHTIQIGDVARFSGSLLRGGLSGTPHIVNPSGADPLHRQYQQGLTATMFYSDSGQDWNWTDSNYMRNDFSVDSEQYDQMTAAKAVKKN